MLITILQLAKTNFNQDQVHLYYADPEVHPELDQKYAACLYVTVMS